MCCYVYRLLLYLVILILALLLVLQSFSAMFDWPVTVYQFAMHAYYYASVGGAPEAYGSRHRVCVSFRKIAVRIFSMIGEN